MSETQRVVHHAKSQGTCSCTSYCVSGLLICEIHGTTYCPETADSLESIARHTVLFREFQSNGLKA